jgi:hypothetical protein
VKVVAPQFLVVSFCAREGKLWNLRKRKKLERSEKKGEKVSAEAKTFLLLSEESKRRVNSPDGLFTKIISVCKVRLYGFALSAPHPRLMCRKGEK